MMMIRDLLYPDSGLLQFAVPEMDPLREEDALQEAQVVDVRFDAVSRVVGIIFALRQALQLREANTGVLVARDVREVNWASSGRDTKLTAWPVGSSVPGMKDGLFEFRLYMWPPPCAQLVLVAESAAFFVGDVPNLRETPLDYGVGDRRLIDSDLAGWESSFEPASAVFLHPKIRR